ncbi:MAG: Ubiquinone/menaquinone biosynthesis C-methyltransferase UbiE [Candidatus Heimdallarchaeota archaeon LC_3]|nr:MAG: Ubiquinone/menaquinone biosynthesis C-methyltransferase UbiE [Candidatus Heimdallarchaeota archaeon LC_3]
MKEYPIKHSDITGSSEDEKLLQDASLKNLHYLVYEDFRENIGIIDNYDFGTTKLDELEFLPILYDIMKGFSTKEGNENKKIQILDAGCGTGQVLIDLLECGCLDDVFLIVGLDVNTLRLGKETKKRLNDYLLSKDKKDIINLHSFMCDDNPPFDFSMSERDIVLISGDIQNVYCIPDNTFDIIITHRLFSFVFDVVKALGECLRMLRPGGVLFIPIEYIIKSGIPSYFLELEMDDESEKKYLIDQVLEKKSRITYSELKKDHKVDRYEAINYFKHKFKWSARIGLAETSDYLRVEKISFESPKDEDLPHFVGPVYGDDVQFVLYRKEKGARIE